MATSSLGKPVLVNGDVNDLIERLKNSKKSFMIKKPKNHDLIIHRFPRKPWGD